MMLHSVRAFTQRLSFPSRASAVMESELPGSWMNLDTLQSDGAEPVTQDKASDDPLEVVPQLPLCKILTTDLQIRVAACQKYSTPKDRLIEMYSTPGDR